MPNTQMYRVIIAVFLFTITISLSLVCVAAATTEYDCVNGGGHVASGSGCSFCVGGKYDLADIEITRKTDTDRSAQDNKTEEKSPGNSRNVAGSKTSRGD